MKLIVYIPLAFILLTANANSICAQKGTNSKKLLADKRKNKNKRKPQKNTYRFKQYEKTSKKELDSFKRRSKLDRYGKKADKKVAKKNRKNATSAFSSKNKRKKRRNTLRLSKDKLQEQDPFRPNQKNKGLAGRKRKNERDSFRYSDRRHEKKKARNRSKKSDPPKLGLKNAAPTKVKRNKKKIN
ncbi:MAG: hypothetical protein CL833_11370 [Crocinitomicaceae bacterium]|nr:hypothetical protein [Crocinitomicaceae bacterium]